MAAGLERDTELLEIQNVAAWRQQLMAGAAGLFSAGPLGLAASLLAFRKVEGQWLPWVLIGILSAPPLAYGQWRMVRAIQQLNNGELAATGSALAARCEPQPASLPAPWLVASPN